MELKLSADVDAALITVAARHVAVTVCEVLIEGLVLCIVADDSAKSTERRRRRFDRAKSRLVISFHPTSKSHADSLRSLRLNN